MRAVQSQCCSPDEVIFGADFAQSLYCHLLCALRRHPPRRPLADARHLAGRPAGRVGAPRRAEPRAGRRRGAQVRRPEQLVRGDPGAVAQRQVRVRHHDGVHGALREEAPALRGRAAAGRRRVRRVRGVDWRQRGARGAARVRHLHRAPRHRLLRVHPPPARLHGRPRPRRLLRRVGARRPDGRRRGRALRGRHDHIRRYVARTTAPP
uniref:Uncharacterized protein n=1 Tax=Aegilops tauschii subsp. strangulata TaxID=200361 RepID=A0A453EFX5_AEGTS